MSMRLLLSVAAMSVAGQACNKTVVSDKVVPVRTPDTTPAQNNGTIEGQTPDTKSKIRISKAACEAERKTEFQLKVRGLVGTDWIRLSCDDIKNGKEFEVDSKKGYCNVLELKADVSFTKTGLPSENYVRASSNLSDKVFFRLEPVSGSAATSALKISFEDTNDEYWNKGFQYCSNNPGGTIGKVPITGVINQKCDAFMQDPGMAVDFNDFVFSVESNDVEFAVENQPEIGCKPGQ